MDRLEGRPSDLRQALEILSDLFLTDPELESPTDLPDLREYVDGLDVSPGLEQLVVERTISEYEDRLDTPEFVDAEPIATYLVTKPLRQPVSEELSCHPFPNALEDVSVGPQDSEIEITDASPDEVVQYWDDVVKPTLEETIKHYETSLEETSFLQVLERSRLESTLKEYRSEYRRLDSLHTEYKHLHELDEWVVDEHLDAEMRLHERRSELEERLSKTENRLDRLRRKRTRLEQKCETIRDRLSSAQTTPYLTRLSVTDVEIAAGSVESGRIEELSDLVEQDLLEPNSFERALGAALSRLAEPVEDRSAVSGPREAVLVVQATERDAELLVDVSGFDEVIDQRSTDPYAVRFTALFGPIDLEATSEFGTIDEWFTDSDRDVSAQFGGGVSDDTVVRSFAYPELLPDSTNRRD